jgi:hypothetical protein
MAFQGFLKRIRIGDQTTNNLELKWPRISERLYLPIPVEKFDCFQPGGVNKACNTLEGWFTFQDQCCSVVDLDEPGAMDTRRERHATQDK